RVFDEQFFLAIERSRRAGDPVSVMMIDLDHFKQINDDHGHQAGDDALRQIGRLLLGRRRVTDLVARYGGEEFVWVLPGARTENAVEVAEWLRRAIAEVTVQTGQGRLGLTVSIGLATFDPQAHGPIGSATVLEVADQALRDAKTAGRNRVVVRALGAERDTGPEAGAAPPADESGEEEPGMTRYR
ncbi:MAG: GGDEF domain-containing protein, partial [Armatimonadota bacterium]|nr:GGDEF domain-containing protein [Armatimonadota bacterium]